MDQVLYDLLGLVGFTHPLHPVLITMVVGPVIASFLFAAVAFFLRKPEFYKTSRQLTVLAFFFWFPTVAVGILDWMHFYGASANMPEINAKLVLAGILFVVLLGHILLFKRSERTPWIPVAFMLVATGLVSALGSFGGDIVFGRAPEKNASAPVSAGPASKGSDGYKELVQDGFTLGWKVHDKAVDVRVSYPTDGWVGFGIGKTGTMEGSHIVLGFVMDGQAHIEDHFGYARDEHAPQAQVGGKDSLTARSGTYADGKTTIRFTMPLDTGNPRDPVLVEGETYKVILANGGDGAQDLESYHGRTGRIVVDLTL